MASTRSIRRKARAGAYSPFKPNVRSAPTAIVNQTSNPNARVYAVKTPQGVQTKQVTGMGNTAERTTVNPDISGIVNVSKGTNPQGVVTYQAKYSDGRREQVGEAEANAFFNQRNKSQTVNAPSQNSQIAANTPTTPQVAPGSTGTVASDPAAGTGENGAVTGDNAAVDPNMPVDQAIPTDSELEDTFFSSSRAKQLQEQEDLAKKRSDLEAEVLQYQQDQEIEQQRELARRNSATAQALTGGFGNFGAGNIGLSASIEQEGAEAVDRALRENRFELRDLVQRQDELKFNLSAQRQAELDNFIATKQDEVKQENAERWNKFLQVKGLEFQERAEIRAESAEQRQILQTMFQNQLAVNVETRAQQEFESSQAKAEREETLAMFNLPLDMFDKAIKATGNRQGSIAYVTQTMSNLGMEVDPAIFEKPGGFEGVVSTLSQMGIKEWTPAISGAVIAQYGKDLSTQERAMIKAAGDSWGALTPGEQLDMQYKSLQMRQLVEENGWGTNDDGIPVTSVSEEGLGKLYSYLENPGSVPKLDGGYNCVLNLRECFGEDVVPYGLKTFNDKLGKINVDDPNTPILGSVAVIDTGDSIGHVAFVDNVNPDGTVEITEFNYNSPVSHRVGTPQDLNIRGYIAGSGGTGVTAVQDLTPEMRQYLDYNATGNLPKGVKNEKIFASKAAQFQEQFRNQTKQYDDYYNTFLSNISYGAGVSDKDIQLRLSALQDAMLKGDTDQVKRITRNAVLGGQEEAAKFNDLNTMLVSFGNLGKELDNLRKQGIDTGFFRGGFEKGAQTIGKTTDPKLARVKSLADIALVNYIKAQSGTAVTDFERNFLQNVLPDISNDFDLNNAKWRAFMDNLQIKRDSPLRFKLGDERFEKLFMASPEKSIQENLSRVSKAANVFGPQQQGRVSVISPSGQRGEIPASEVEQARQEGYTILE